VAVRHVDSVDYRLVRAFRSQVTERVLAPFVARVKQRYGDFAWPGENSTEAAVWASDQHAPGASARSAISRLARHAHCCRKAGGHELGKQPGGLGRAQLG
jgi:penicillin amidase